MAFIPEHVVLERRALGVDTTDNQTVLQHLYFIIAVSAALLLVAARLYVLRRRNRPISDFFILGRGNPRPEDGLSYGSSYQPSRSGVPLAPIPPAYRPDRRVRAADVDADGRRLSPDDGDWDGKDALPAYDKIGGPPKYIEALGHDVGAEDHFQPVGQSLSAPSPFVGTVESGAGNYQSADTPVGDGGQLHPGAHADAEIAFPEAVVTPSLPPPAHHEGRSS
ncbi:hypothetical protein F5I97DRAFT_1931282 [Phlebopus sp. FC_14]|nr:hypothetical protein F5I97DRAFT_1931282 [Phlebopus sp. FC_14]